MGKKSRRVRGPKQPIGARSREERQLEIDKIEASLATLELDDRYEEIVQLKMLLREYVANGERVTVNIPFPEANRCIQGILAPSKREKVWVRLVPQGK